MKIAVTGANGFIGGAMVKRLLNEGHTVVALSRSPIEPAQPHLTWLKFHIESPQVSPADLEGVDLIIHAAYEMGVRVGSQERNIRAALTLYRMSASLGARFLFLSSMSAHEDALSAYGRSKWSIENALDPGKAIVVKPGLVVGDGGLYQRMRQSVERLPVLPVFDGGLQPIQLVRVQDLTEFISVLGTRKITGIWPFAIHESITMRTLLSRIASAVEKRPRFLDLPSKWVYPLIRTMERFNVPLPITTENLDGLRKMRVFDASSSAAILGRTLRMDEITF